MNFKIRKNWKMFFPVFLVFLIFLLGIAAGKAIFKKNNIIYLTKNIESEFKNGLQNLNNFDFSAAKKNFLNTKIEIKKIQNIIEPINLRQEIFTESKLQTAQKFLLIAEKFIEITKILTDILENTKNTSLEFLTSSNDKIIEKISTNAEKQKKVLFLFAEIKNIFENISKENLDELQPLAEKISENLSTLENFLEKFSEILIGLEKIFQNSPNNKMAIFFQNSSEIRANGGFMGTGGFLSFREKLHFQFFDIYELDWKNKSHFDPPLGFERITDRLFLRDANQFLDFSKSAQEMRTMLEISQQDFFPHIVVISDKLLPKILQEIGPVEIPGTTEIADVKNANFLLSFLVESKFSGQHSPKITAKKFLSAVFEKLKELPTEKLAEIFLLSLKEKLILLDSTNNDVDKMAINLGFSGEILHPKTDDFLAISRANVGGNKSDRFLQEEIIFTSIVSENGEIVDHLEIFHQLQIPVFFQKLFTNLQKKYPSQFVDEKILEKILISGENHQFIKIFVPQGSKILSSKNLPLEEIKQLEESGKTVFAFRFPQIKPELWEKIEISYQLPNRISFEQNLRQPLRLFFQNQPGMSEIYFQRKVLTDFSIKILQSSPSKISISPGENFLFSDLLEK